MLKVGSMTQINDKAMFSSHDGRADSFPHATTYPTIQGTDSSAAFLLSVRTISRNIAFANVGVRQHTPDGKKRFEAAADFLKMSILYYVILFVVSLSCIVYIHYY